MKTIAIIALVLGTVVTAHGQSAEEAFHDGAQLFVAGDLTQALAVVEAGLAASPGHPKLDALKKLIEEEEEQEQGATGSQDQEEQKPEDSGDESEQQSPSQGNQEDESQEESQQEQQQPSDDGQPPESNPDQPEENADTEERQSTAAGQENSEELSRAQALRILQALQHEEEQLLREVQKVKGKARRVEKDW